jgi:hypothetical protein
VGDHHRIGVGRARRLPPVVDQRVSQVIGVGPDHDAPSLAVLVRPPADVAAPEVRERLTIPRLRLAMDLMQLDRTDLVRERPEDAASIDLRQLPVVADEHELGLDIRGVLHQAIDDPRPDHSRLIYDEN